MSRPVFALALLVVPFLAASTPGKAADNAVTVVPPPPIAATTTEPKAVSIEKAKKFAKPPPQVTYGCKRVWRCDTEVCEWRRGCWGAYGYMEGPYYTDALAKKQWERDGWAPPGRPDPH